MGLYHFQLGMGQDQVALVNSKTTGQVLKNGSYRKRPSAGLYVSIDTTGTTGPAA